MRAQDTSRISAEAAGGESRMVWGGPIKGQGVAHRGQGSPMGVRGAPGRAGVANRVAEMSQRALGLTHKALGGWPMDQFMWHGSGQG